MRTTETVTLLALYDSECCNAELILDDGDAFPTCPTCGELCTWELEDEIEPTEDMERFGTAA